MIHPKLHSAMDLETLVHQMGFLVQRNEEAGRPYGWGIARYAATEDVCLDAK